MAYNLPSLPAPSTWATGEIVTAPQLRSDVANAVQFLSARPMFIGQNLVTATSATSATTTAVTWDAELYDNWHGHAVAVDNTIYFAQIAGWYLCECSMPLAYSGGSGTLSAEIGGQQDNGSFAWYGGARIPNNNGHFTEATCAKLMLMEYIQPFGGTGDYIQGGVYQSSNVAELMSITLAKAPFISCRWVSAVTGSAPLIVPTNDAFPVPPAYLQSLFMNKNVRDTIGFLIYPPVFEVAQTIAQNLASQSSVPLTGTTLNLSATVVVDNYSAWTSGNATWTAPVAGVYYCYGLAGMTATANAVTMGAGLTVTSANYNSGAAYTIWSGMVATSASAVQAVNVRRRLRLNAGDTIQLAGYQRDSGGAAAALQNSGSWVSRLITVWETA